MPSDLSRSSMTNYKRRVTNGKTWLRYSPITTSKILCKLSLVSSLAVCVLLLNGCGLISKLCQSQCQQTVNVCPNPPKVDELQLRDTPPTATAAGKVEFTAKDYENLALNLQDILAMIKQQQAVMKYYRSCMEPNK